jgi:hypothetical protein
VAFVVVVVNDFLTLNYLTFPSDDVPLDYFEVEFVLVEFVQYENVDAAIDEVMAEFVDVA